MSSNSIADAKNRLPSLVSASQRGERVTIARHGKPVAGLRPASNRAKRVSAASIEWWEDQLADLPPPREGSVRQFEALRGERGDG